MRKILITLLLSAVMTAAIAYLTHVIRGEMGVKLLEVNNYPSELVAVFRNDGEATATIRGYEFLEKADNGRGARWDQISLGDLQVTLEPGETRDISLSTNPISGTSGGFKVRFFIMNSTRGQYSLDWESGD
jgi:hypothetical protein